MTGSLAATAAVTLCVLGMMLIVGGVLTAGLFIPGVVLNGIGLVGFAVAGVLHMRQAVRVREAVPADAPSARTTAR